MLANWQLAAGYWLLLPMLTDQAILRHIERQPNHSAGYKQLIREMGLRGEDRRQLAERLKALVKSARLIETGRDRYTLAEHAAARQNLVAGRLSMHRDGYGFVVPNAAQRSTLEGDIFIPPNAIGSAMHGDQVLVELGRKKDDGRAEGRILRVLTRGNPTVVGTFHHGSRNNYVTPIDEKVTQEIVIPHGLEWPSGEKQDEEERVPHPSRPNLARGWDPGDPLHPPLVESGTKGKKSSRKQSRDRVLGSEAPRHDFTELEGVVVEVEITDWPSSTGNPRGRVIEILGYEDDFGVDVEIMIRKFHLPHRFPVEVLQEAQQFDPVIHASELRHRQDYR